MSVWKSILPVIIGGQWRAKKLPSHYYRTDAWLQLRKLEVGNIVKRTVYAEVPPVLNMSSRRLA